MYLSNLTFRIVVGSVHFSFHDITVFETQHVAGKPNIRDSCVFELNVSWNENGRYPGIIVQR